MMKTGNWNRSLYRITEDKMISVFSYNRILKEQNIIEKGCRYQVAKRSDDKLSFTMALSGEELSRNSGDSLTDIIYYEIRDKQDVEHLRQLRKKESAAMLMLLSSPRVSPLQYLKPGIAPDLLLLRPFAQDDFDAVNTELFDAFWENLNAFDGEDSFIVTSREGKTLFPYSKILFFEAHNKKINLRVGNEEYDFYDSIDNLSNIVPSYFMRCHRAYLINIRKIQKVNMSEGLIKMDNGVTVPLSRTYKQDFKTLIR